MADLFSAETKIIEAQTKCDLNSEYCDKLVMKEVTKRSKDLDAFVDKLKDIVFSDPEEMTTKELESGCAKLSLLLYDFETQTEYADIRMDISYALEKEKYNYLYTSFCKDKSLTVASREALVQSQTFTETIVSMVAKHVSKLLNKKKTAAYELLGTVKKILTSRIASSDYNA